MLMTILIRLIGCLIILGGIGAAVLFGQANTLTCGREAGGEGSCEIVRSGLAGTSTRQVPLAELRGASVETSRGSKGYESYRVVLLTDTGRVPLTSVFTGPTPQPQRETVDRITHFLNDHTQPSLLETDDNRAGVYLFSALVAGVGAVWLFIGLWKGGGATASR